MREARLWLSWMGGALIAGCSSAGPGGPSGAGASGDDDPGTVVARGGAAVDAGASTPDGGAGASTLDGGAGASTPDGGAVSPSSPATDGSAGPDGPMAPDSAPAPAPAAPPLCPAAVSWGGDMQLSISTSGNDTFGAITPDELTIAWTTSTGAVAVTYADRADVADEFGSTQTVQGDFATGQVALSADGLRLAVLSSDATTLSVLVRTARGMSFEAPPMQGEFSEIDTNVTQGEAAVHLGDPVFGAGDATFYYSLYGSGRQDTALEAVRPAQGAAWTVGTGLAGSQLLAAGPERRHPTGISADDLTLLYWDDVSASEKMTWRPTVGDAFGAVTDIGMRPGAQPNAACTAIYYSGQGQGGPAVFVATAQ
jgi:hypothetical protein